MSAATNAFGGIYAVSNQLLNNKSSQLPTSIFTDPNITGVALSLSWATLEPSAGSFDWTSIDGEIAQAVASGKKISLAVYPNRFSAPSWLFQEGVQDLNFTVLNHGGLNNIDIAPPWDPIYQQAYAGLMQALSDHLKSIPGAYDAVTMVKISGMSEISAEMRLPNAPDTKNGVTNAIPVWQAAGYTPSKVISAWQGFANSVNNAFPDKVLSLETIAVGAFPNINEAGQYVSTNDPTYVDVTQQIIQQGVAQFGNRFAVQWDSLNQKTMGATVLEASQLGAIAGWQANRYLGPDGSGGGSDWTVKIPLTAAVFQQLLELGIYQGAAQYMEVWPANVPQFAAALAQAEQEIASAVKIAPGTTVEITTPSSGDAIFSGGQGTLRLDDSAHFTGYIGGFRGGDVIDLRDIAFGANTKLSYKADSTNLNGTFTISDGVHSATIGLAGQYGAGNLHLASDGHGGTAITDVLVAGACPNIVATHNQVFAASSLFTTSDPFAVKFELKDTGASGAYFQLNSGRIVANQGVIVTAAQLAKLKYFSGSGSDTLKVRISDDGVNWSTWSQSFTVTGPVDSGAVVTAPDSSWAHNASPYVRALFTAANAFNDPITEYQLVDNTAGATSGYFLVNGVAQSAGQVIDLTAAQLSSAEFQTGWGTDNLSVRAFDGRVWGAWTSFNVAAPDNPGPSVTAANLTAVQGQSFVSASLFAAKNVFNNDPIDQYDVRNSGTGGGTFYLNGQALAANQDNYLTAAQLAGLTYISGSGADTLQVRASEDGQWSAWASFTVTYDSGPAISAPNSSWGHNVAPMVRSLFTATDPIGLAISEYQFVDNTTSGMSGYFVVNGVAQAAGQVIDLAATQLANVSFQTSWVSDNISMRAFDGTAWGAWTTFQVAPPPNPGPTVTASNLSALQGQSFAASSLFTAKNVFNAPIEQYDLWNNNTGGGTFYLNGQALAANQDNYLTAAQLAGVTYIAGAGVDTLQVRASEGGVWSSWANFNVSYDTGPSITAPNSNWGHGVNPNVRALFTASDPVGLAVTEYQFIDNTAGTTSGYFIVTGVAQGAGQVIDLTAAQLATTTFQMGWISDSISMRAFDGTAWGAWTTFAVTPPANPGPAVTAANLITQQGQSFAAASLFTAKNVFNAPIEQYDLWNSGIGGGTFYLNGQALVANQDNYLTAAQLAGVTYVAGSGADALQVRASEGGVWSAWASFTVSNNTGPVITAPNSSWGHKASPFVRALFTATDPVGLAITEYQFIDRTAAATSGYFTINGVAQAAQQVIDLTAAQLGSAEFQTSWTSDTLSVRAFDGVTWSSWVDFQVSPPANPGPTVTAANLTAVLGQSFTPASLFTAKNVFNDPIDQYDLKNTGVGGGTFYLNGQALAAGQDNYLTAAQLAGVTYVAGSGVDSLKVRATEGGVWSAWASFSVSYDSGPMITAPNSNWGHGTAPNVRALFTASDPVGLAITEYQFVDNTADALSGYFTFNGVAQGAGQVIDLTAAQLASAGFQMGWVSDSISMRAFDGTAWSAWTNFTVTPPPNPGPTVTARNVTTLQGQSFAAASVFTARNVFTDPIEQYDVWNSGASGGAFYLNGQALAANQDNYLTAAQFAATTYVVGSGTDTLQVRASEGGVWSAWAPATMATATNIGPGAIVELASAFSGTVGFAANTGTLKLDNSASFGGTVAGYGNMDKIDFADIDPTVATLGYTGNATQGTLMVSDGTHTANLTLLGQYSASMFVLSSDTHGGTLFNETPAAQIIAVNHVS